VPAVITQLDRAPGISLLTWFARAPGLISRRPPSRRSDLGKLELLDAPPVPQAVAAAAASAPNRRQRGGASTVRLWPPELGDTNAVMPHWRSGPASRASGARPAPVPGR